MNTMAILGDFVSKCPEDETNNKYENTILKVGTVILLHVLCKMVCLLLQRNFVLPNSSYIAEIRNC